jgi:hypothetical protein
MPSPDQLPERLTVVALHDPTAEAIGFAAESDYVTWCYRPRLGCTALVTWRYLAALLVDQDRVALDVVEAARNLGLRPSRARTAPMATTLGHLVAFGLAQWRGDEYALRLSVPPLGDRQVARLPGAARSFHERTMRGR